MLQEALLPPWVMKALMALLALLALAAILWLTLLKPAIKSAAKDAVKAPLAAQDAKVQEWHQQNFGTNTSTDMPKGGPVVEGKWMPGGSEWGKGPGG